MLQVDRILTHNRVRSESGGASLVSILIFVLHVADDESSTSLSSLALNGSFPYDSWNSI